LLAHKKLQFPEIPTELADSKISLEEFFHAPRNISLKFFNLLLTLRISVLKKNINGKIFI